MDPKPSRARTIAGIILAAIGVALIFSPGAVADALARQPTNVGEAINLRASWGGSLLGIGLSVAFVRAWSPRWWIGVGVVMWLMLGIAVGRGVGFILDGAPDTMQWIWIVAEVVIAGACAAALRRRSR